MSDGYAIEDTAGNYFLLSKDFIGEWQVKLSLDGKTRTFIASSNEIEDLKDWLAMMSISLCEDVDSCDGVDLGELDE